MQPLSHEELTAEERRQVDEVQQIITALEKTTKAQKLYLPNNKILIQHRENLFALFKEFLQKNAELTFIVQSQDFYFLKTSIYHNENKKESFAYRLYNEGMRSLRFLDGLTARELDDFIDLLNSDWENTSTEAMTTMLWEKEFDHINYVIAEYILDDAEDQVEEKVDEILDPQMSNYAGPTSSPPTEDIEEEIDLDSLIEPSKFRDLAKDRCVLDDEEFALIQREIANGEKHDRLRMDLFDILVTLILEEQNEKELDELYQILLETIDATVTNGELHITSTFVWALRGLLEGGLGDFTLRHPDRVLQVLTRLAEPDRLIRYLNALNLGHEGNAKDIVTFFGCLPKTAFPTLLGHIHIVASPTATA